MIRRTAVLSAIVLVALAAVVGAAAALPGPAPATSSDVRPETLAQAREIRAQVTARYRLAPGRKLSVTEATSMAVLDSLTLLTTANELRVVPTDDGIYFAICSARARCPYPARAASWPASAFLPRRQALELAVRTFLETSATLVVVALPTAEPVWLVFERNDLTGLAAPALRTQLTADPEVTNAALRHVVDQLTLPRLFVPVAIVPVSGTTETMLAVSLDNGR